MVDNISHFEIPADGIASLQGFYHDLFGWTFERVGGLSTIILLLPRRTQKGMMVQESPERGPTNYVQVEPVEHSLKKAQGLDATVIVPKSPVPGMVWFASLIDSQNNLIGLWQDDPKVA